MKQVGERIPDVTFKVRVRDDSIQGNNPYRWEDVTTDDLFGGRRVVLFSLPGAFTPTCSNFQLPGFQQNFDQFKEKGIDRVYCISVNDSFVMNQWLKQPFADMQVYPIPDGNAEFTTGMGMLVQKTNLGFGGRSWRYSAIIDDGVIEMLWVEAGKVDNCEEDPYVETTPQKILDYLDANA